MGKKIGTEKFGGSAFVFARVEKMDAVRMPGCLDAWMPGCRPDAGRLDAVRMPSECPGPHAQPDN